MGLELARSAVSKGQSVEIKVCAFMMLKYAFIILKKSPSSFTSLLEVKHRVCGIENKMVPIYAVFFQYYSVLLFVIKKPFKLIKIQIIRIQIIIRKKMTPKPYPILVTT